MTTDDELRKLIPALPHPYCRVNESTPQWSWDGYSDEQMKAHALATARAVWAAAIKRAELACHAESLADDTGNPADIAYNLACLHCAAAIRSIGSGEQI